MRKIHYENGMCGKFVAGAVQVDDEMNVNERVEGGEINQKGIDVLGGCRGVLSRRDE